MNPAISPADKSTYWRLSGFYFFYFAVLGALVPYWGLYLQSLGYDAREIGAISAVIMASKIVAPNIWGWLGDKTGQRMRIIRLGCLLACVCFIGVFIDQRFHWLLWVVACYTFFWNAVLAQFEVITLDCLGEQYQRYSRVRLWGSIGFIVSVTVLGLAFDYLSIRLLPMSIMALLLLIWFSSLAVNTPERRHNREAGDGLWAVIKRPAVWSFLLCCFLLQLSHGAYYTFYSLYLEVQGYDRSTIGLLWALGVAAEVALFLLMHRLLAQIQLRHLMLLSLLLTALRWWLISEFVDSLFILLLAQLLHAFSFGVAHAVAVEWVRRSFGRAYQGRGQALYSSLSFGAGGALGACISGYLWLFSEALSFQLAALVALLALVVAWLGMRTDGLAGPD